MSKQTNIEFIGRDYDNNSSTFKSSSYLPNHLNSYYKYGKLFDFQPDQQNPHFKEYFFHSPTLLKQSNNFTVINSSKPILPEGKQTLQLRLAEKSINILMGICTKEIRYSSSVYSSQFIGITFWGNYYNKSDKILIDCDLRIQKDSIVTMVVDFYKYEISWLIDSRLIASLSNEEAFMSDYELYFVVGVRDNDLSL